MTKEGEVALQEELQKLLKHHKFNSTNILSFIPLDEKLDKFFKKIS